MHNLLTFDSATHTYFYDNEPCCSVTQLIKSYARGFDVDYHSERIAGRKGVSGESVRREWADKGEVASDRGNSVHDYAQSLAGQARDHCLVLHQSDTDSNPFKKAVARFWARNVSSMWGDVIEGEFRVVDPEHLIAGTVDLIASCDGVRGIRDYKTSREIDVLGFSKNFYAPIHHITDSSYWTYALQLSCYATLLRSYYDYDSQSLGIVHLLPSGEYELYPVIEMQDEAKHIIRKGIRSRGKH